MVIIPCADPGQVSVKAYEQAQIPSFMDELRRMLE